MVLPVCQYHNVASVGVCISVSAGIDVGTMLVLMRVSASSLSGALPGFATVEHNGIKHGLFNARAGGAGLNVGLCAARLVCVGTELVLDKCTPTTLAQVFTAMYRLDALILAYVRLYVTTCILPIFYFTHAF
jgi:hypothetical protein